ncbi:amidase [Salinibacter sp. 10B]|uniref:amidase n=1 Tax=Salinibacter sp. 10B TaxID=1923971 RepID=UPI000CF3AD67|nr:amidase [Salinibacter sp. 10B]PQJ33291.1 amidase [Salinibacter sp. 10B]
MTALSSCSATELARRIRSHDCSVVEVVAAHLHRIERWNADVNAVVTLDVDRARRRARAADRALAAGRVWGPLHGVPFTVKDQFATAGLRTTYGLPSYSNYRPDADGPLVNRLRQAGGILLGKTNLPLAAYDWQSRNPQFGRTNNPWDLARTPGGSSGGSGAALAAGFAPLELGADVAGSIRVPSHFCGVVGLRPTEGTLPLNGLMPPNQPRTVQHVVVAGPMARTVEDLQLAWSVLHSPPTADPPSLASLRIAVTSELGGVPVDTDTQRVLRETVRTLRDAGCTVERRSSPVNIDSALETWAHIQGFELNAGLPFPLRTPPLRDVLWHGIIRYKFGFLGRLLAQGARLSPQGYLTALDRKKQLTETLDTFLSSWDLWLTPVASRPAFSHRQTGRALSIEGVSVPYALPFAAYNCATAVTGHPILTLPAGDSSDGLPIGVQVHARSGEDAALLRAGRQLASALDLQPRRAPLKNSVD